MSKKKATLLDLIIKFLIILLLLGVLFILALYIKDHLDESKSQIQTNQAVKAQQNKETIEIINPQPPKREDREKNITEDKKVYTEEEMQELMQMMIDQLQELKAETQTEDQTDQNQSSDLESTLESIESETSTTVNEENIDETNITTDATTSDKKVDHYNKVVITKDSYSDENINDLSRQIGEVIEDITSNKTEAKSNYTKAIKPEVRVREDAMRVIVVRRGDSLSKIALRAYGKVSGYHKIVEANRDLIKNPNHIYVGQRLRIPTL